MSNLEDEEKLKSFLRNIEEYDNTQSYRHKILMGDQPTMNVVQYVISSILRDPVAESVQKLMAVRLARDSIETFNDDFITQSQYSILPQMEKIALFAKDNSDDEQRGRRYFSSQPTEEQAKLGNSFIQLVLECIWVWSKWFPIDPDTNQISAYRITLEKLIQQKVRFPKVIYFKFEQISKYLPEQMIPIKLLQELRKVVSQDLQKTNNEGSSTKFLASRLYCDIRKELSRDEREDIFYSDLVRKCYRKNKRPAATEQLQQNYDDNIDQDLQYQDLNVPNSRPNEQVQNEGTQNILLQQNDQLRIQVKQLQNELLANLKEKSFLQSEIQKKDQNISVLLQQQEILKEKISNYEQNIQQISNQMNYQISAYNTQGYGNLVGPSKQTQSIYRPQEIETQYKNT